MKRGLYFLALVFALPACTTLNVHKFDGAESNRRGIAYFLPFTQFKTKVTWWASCDKKTNEFSLTPKIEATPSTGPDPNGLYVIDYESLSAFTKTSSVKVDFYDSGAIKSINASADDRTGEILTKTITAAGKVAKVLIAAGNDKAFCSGHKKDDKVPGEGLIGALESVSDQKTEVQNKTTALEKATDDLTASSALLARAAGSVTDGMRDNHNKVIGAVVAAQSDLDVEKAKLVDLQDAVSYSVETTFPETSDRVASEEGLQIPYPILEKWIAEKDQETATERRARLDGYAKLNSIWFELASNAAFASTKSPPDTGDSRNGIRYRLGVPGQLKVCKGGACSVVAALPAPAGGAPTIGSDLTDPVELVKSFPVTVLQQGSTFFLPFSSKAFTNGSLTATFSEGGVLTSAGYEQKKSAGEQIAGVADTLADQVAAVVEETRKNDRTELEKLEDEVKLAKAQKELADAKAALVQADPTPGQQEITALAADTTVKQAQLANVNADIALAAAHKQLAEAAQP